MEGNGKMDAEAPAGAAAPPPKQSDQAQVQAQIAAMQPTIKAVLENVYRGIIYGAAGARPDAVVTIICYEIAQCVGKSLNGDLGTVLQIRKACIDAFGEGLRKAPPNAHAPPRAALPPNIRG